MASVPETSACDSLSFIMETAMIMVDFTWCPFGYKRKLDFAWVLLLIRKRALIRVDFTWGLFVDKGNSHD